MFHMDRCTLSFLDEGVYPCHSSTCQNVSFWKALVGDKLTPWNILVAKIANIHPPTSPRRPWPTHRTRPSQAHTRQTHRCPGPCRVFSLARTPVAHARGGRTGMHKQHEHNGRHGHGKLRQARPSPSLDSMLLEQTVGHELHRRAWPSRSLDEMPPDLGGMPSAVVGVGPSLLGRWEVFFGSLQQRECYWRGAAGIMK